MPESVSDSVTLEKAEQFISQYRGKLNSIDEIIAGLKALQHAGLDRLPLPGKGQTWLRWRILARCAGLELSFGKLLEAHADAIAITDELGEAGITQTGFWAVWAAEPPSARLEGTLEPDGQTVILNGMKAWCSGAGIVSHALVTARDADHKLLLCAVDMKDPGISIDNSDWHAIGMKNTSSFAVAFREVKARLIGAPEVYIERPGFWQGGAGVAACWYGPTVRLSEALRTMSSRSHSPHVLATLGLVDSLMHSMLINLQFSAQWIDAHPAQSAELLAMRLRSTVERDVQSVIHSATRAMGPYPYCADIELARLLADLPVFLRQHHGERDWQAIGERVKSLPEGDWLP